MTFYILLFGFVHVSISGDTLFFVVAFLCACGVFTAAIRCSDTHALITSRNVLACSSKTALLQSMFGTLDPCLRGLTFKFTFLVSYIIVYCVDLRSKTKYFTMIWKPVDPNYGSHLLLPKVSNY